MTGRTLHDLRQDVYNAVQGLRRSAVREGALRVTQPRRPDDLKDAASYATEMGALIMKLFNRAVRQAREETI